MEFIVQVGALNDEEGITALGFHLAALPVDVRIGKVFIRHLPCSTLS